MGASWDKPYATEAQPLGPGNSEPQAQEGLELEPGRLTLQGAEPWCGPGPLPSAGSCKLTMLTMTAAISMAQGPASGLPPLAKKYTLSRGRTDSRHRTVWKAPAAQLSCELPTLTELPSAAAPSSQTSLKAAFESAEKRVLQTSNARRLHRHP